MKMITIHSILLLVSLIFFVLSAFSVESKTVKLQSAGLALWVLSILIGG